MGGTWFRDYRMVRDFRAFESVIFFRFVMSLSAYRRVVRIWTGVVLVGGVPLYWWLLTLFRDEVFLGDPGSAWRSWALLVLYSSAVLIAKELLTRRRKEIAVHPHLQLFRDFDIPIGQVVLQYSLRAVLWQGLALSTATVLFLIVFGTRDPT